MLDVESTKKDQTRLLSGRRSARNVRAVTVLGSNNKIKAAMTNHFCIVVAMKTAWMCPCRYQFNLKKVLFFYHVF